MNLTSIILFLALFAVASYGSAVPANKFEANGFQYLGSYVGKSRVEMDLYISPPTQQLTFLEAALYCEKTEGKLVSIELHGQRSLINTKLLTLGSPIVWTSAAFNPENSNWVWTGKNTPMTYFLWYKDETPATPVEGDCAYFQPGMFSNNGLKSATCILPFRFICEY